MSNPKRPDEVFFDALLPKQVEAKQAEPGISVPAEPAQKPITSRNLFSHTDAHPVALDYALLRQFKLEWLTWTPDVIFHEIERIFKTSIAEVNRIKIMAVAALHVTDTFWEQWEIFEKTIQALNGVVPQFEVLQPPDLGLLLAGVDMAKAVREETFSEEVSRYCAAIFLSNDTVYAPPPLDFCQPYLSDPRYKCADCGKIGPALPPWKGVCDSCTHVFEDDYPLNFKPDPERIAKGFGKNVTVTLTYDPASVRAKFEELKKLPDVESMNRMMKEETPENIQAGRLLIAKDYEDFKTKQLADQLSGLRDWLSVS